MRQSIWYFVFAAAAAPVLIGACGGDDANERRGQGTVGSTGLTSAVAPNDDIVARGQYLVDGVSGCGECHTPKDNTGKPIQAQYLAGVDCFVGVDNPNAGPSDPPGCLSTRNLTNDPTGLKNRTDTHIRNMFQNGVRPNGEFLNSVMPYWVFHNMTDDDANAIVAYLRTVPAVSHAVKPNQFPWINVPAPVPPIDMTTIYTPPSDGNPAFDSQMRGRYLAAVTANCIDCHTPETGSPPVPDRSRWFAGDRDFNRDALKLPPVFPPDIYSQNLTSDDTGIKAYSVQDIVNVIKLGHDRNGQGVCPPMPVGPTGTYGNMTDGDATDIATYLKVLPPIVNARPADCVVPGTTSSPSSMAGLTAMGRR